ncbi:MAG: TraX family protein [Oscillospiraceae bacterium]
MTSFALKLIAIISMLIDHIEKIFGFHFASLFFAENYSISVFLRCLNGVGRLTFPIMAFFIAEGCKKTANINQYSLRLLLFAFLSEPVFDLAFDIYNSVYALNIFTNYTLLSFTSQNVIFTLFFGCASIIVFRHLKTKKILAYIAVIAIGVIAEYLKTEYGFLGVILIFTAYISKTKRSCFISMSTILIALYLFYFAWNNGLEWLKPNANLTYFIFPCIMALASIVILQFYNGRRGFKCKYFFYFFYPLHLLLLVFIREVLFR